MSKRKERQSNRVAPENRLLDDVRAISDKPIVRSVEEHFAGYFNELGITINLTDDAADSDVIELRNALLTYLGGVSLDFTWQISFWRNLKQIALLFPDSKVHPTTGELAHIF